MPNLLPLPCHHTRFATGTRCGILMVVALFALLSLRITRADPYVVDRTANVAYGPLPAEQGDLYAPVMPTDALPAVIVIHGGGWIEGSRQADAGLAKLIAAMGAVVFNIDYRLADPARPETRWPAQLVDAQLAVRFLRSNAARLNLDPTKIGAIGDSAGGQLAVFLGVLSSNVKGAGSELYPKERPNVSAVVDQFGPTDLSS